MPSETMNEVGHPANAPPYNPPSYDFATGGDVPSDSKAPPPKGTDTSTQKLAPIQSPAPYANPAGPSTPHGSPPMGLYQYQHPHSGHVISTMLPPDHPEMICLQEGNHIRRTKYGILGVLAAVFWFPWGIGLCLLDKRVVCVRCGQVIDDGFSC